MNKRIVIVGIGGTQRRQSSTTYALQVCMGEAARLGAETHLVGGPELDLPFYDPGCSERSANAVALVSLLRRADGVILASPGYHGAVSGLFKNALDYLQDTAADAVPYLTGRAVGCIATAAGWQAGGSVLANLRAIVHALRGWPTPLGAQINTTDKVFDSSGACISPLVDGQLRTLTRQVVEFAQHRATDPQRRAHFRAEGTALADRDVSISLQPRQSEYAVPGSSADAPPSFHPA